ncbi:unnamed protein product [Debaryomyces tyrocola]|nr:unnamed protein product [Debaryomyces tyrocola]
MSAMDVDHDVYTVLSTLRLETESNELINIFYQLEDYYERKLYHQLTLTLNEFYENPESKNNRLRIKIYDLFISQFSQKLNSIQVVDFLLASFEDNKEECLNKLLELKGNFVKQLRNNYTNKSEIEETINNEESIIYIDLQIARYYLILNNLEKSETILEHLNPKFESTFENEFSSKINSAFYLTKCQLYKINENYNLFYLNGLLYLSSIKNKSLSIEEQQMLCYDLCIAALLGDKIYNFGELLLHDILNCFKDSQYDWLYNLIHSLNSGNLKNFNKWLAIGFQKSPFLKASEVFLKQKVIIMSLLELISMKSTTNKQLNFKEISEFTGTPVNDVEHLIIKCFSLNLIKGYINQIDEVLVVTWLQPRILNLDQVNVLYNHLCKWNGQVEELAKEVHKNGGSIWAGL